jgi:hypothetical protein
VTNLTTDRQRQVARPAVSELGWGMGKAKGGEGGGEGRALTLSSGRASQAQERQLNRLVRLAQLLLYWLARLPELVSHVPQEVQSLHGSPPSVLLRRWAGCFQRERPCAVLQGGGPVAERTRLARHISPLPYLHQ